MRIAFTEELQFISDQLVEMAGLTATALDQATTALMEADLDKAEAVISADEHIDAVRRDLDTRAVDALARQQPVATDLRTLVTAMRMSADLERMGDLARHVAKLARLRYPHQVLPKELNATFSRMAEVAEALVNEAARIIRDNDVEAVAQLKITDDEMDDLHRDVFRTLLDDDWASGVQAAIDATLLSRYYERFGDHAVSIAQRVVYLVTGQWDDDFLNVEERLEVTEVKS
ncbi:phosphate signaling complex protein PhoU [Ornithinimicrobium faecis]|uniref:Phosphate-specific transport system accessory protein PhoU n=1 Tax=Ornithinimicrobium faecis TaxID=2934158 RepID=A0ABY4YVE7_9MICO|nr:MULTISPECIES: phosphate signaling complex protein PhoU [unclassified Ornithinimicrobium]USQ80731.1 phosphate signaling complex protein PhoU [Ornithinimicrobium sp. HY1793]